MCPSGENRCAKICMKGEGKCNKCKQTKEICGKCYDGLTKMTKEEGQLV